jgi:hypothetical protein
VIDGWRYFGYAPAEGETDADRARRHAQVFLEVIQGQGFAQPNPRRYRRSGQEPLTSLFCACADRDPNQHFRALAGPRVDAYVTLHEPHAFMNAAQP